MPAVRQIEALHDVLESFHVEDKPIFNTEGGWRRNSDLPDSMERAAFIARWYILQASMGVARAYWYGWGYGAEPAHYGVLWDEKSGEHAAAGAYRRGR